MGIKIEKKKSSGNELAYRFKKFLAIHGISKNHADEMRNAGNEKVSFSGTNRKSFTHSAAKRIFKQINSAFDENAVLVKIVPMFSPAWNTGIKAKVFIGISISAFVGIVGARLVADTNRIGNTFDSDGFGTDIFEAG